MLKIYKKVEKSKDNPSGYIELSPNELDRPFLFCISAQDNHDQSIFGTIRQGVRAARVYTSKEIGAGYKVEEFPVDFLGFRFVKENINDDNAVELVSNVLYPYLTKNGIVIEQLIEQAKKMNFMTYCDGTKTFKKIEKELMNQLSINKISDEDIKTIISNIHLIAIGTQVDIRKLNSTCISLVDINDTEIWNSLTYKVRNIMENRNTTFLFGKFNDNSGYYYYDGTSEHDLTEYFREGVSIKPILHLVISKVLEASIHKKKFNINNIIDEIKLLIKNGTNQDKLMDIIDSSLDYGNSPRYTQDELELRKQIDELCYLYEKEKKDKECLEKSDSVKSETIKRMVEGIKKYSSDITFYQILVGMGYWQAPQGMKPYDYLSDREIRNNIEKESNKKL